jgi:hypothetical protein
MKPSELFEALRALIAERVLRTSLSLLESFPPERNYLETLSIV